MPKITVHGGPSNMYEGDPHAEPSSSADVDDGPTIELTRDEDPHAPAARPGEHAPFFAGLNGIGESGQEELTGDEEREALPEVADEEREAPASSTPRKAAKRGGNKA